MNEADQQEIARLKSRMLMKSYYVMLRRVVDREKLAGAALAHYRWIIGLEKEGHVFLSGPLFDAAGGPGVGMTVFRAGDFDEAATLAAGDPFCTSGGAVYELKRWQLNEGRIAVHVDLSDQVYSLG
jgi:uncharacterized protein